MNRKRRSFVAREWGVRVAATIPILLYVLAPPSAFAQELTLEAVRTYRSSFEYEQCANACQIEVDQASSVCMNAALAADQEVDAACLNGAMDRYAACLKSCPVDTGDRRLLDDE